ncbi:UNVERIFIED_CONTAM: LRR receptor-like serine/threonine-protein kinase ER1 [Sesamum indicum]
MVNEKWAMAYSWERIILVGFLAVCLNFASVDCDDGTVLLEIKRSFRDVENVLYDWIDSPSSDYCAWRGVTCDNVTFNVVALNLSGLNLDGEISPAIGQLKGLLSIDLRGNRLSGQIPDEIGDCSALISLDLSFNELYGDIPFSMSKLKQLENLILKNNQLIGPIPSTLSQIPNLKILDLAQNKLSGEIPRLIYWNEVLQYIGLRGNNLQGTLSPDMCQLTGLWYFDVRNNSLSGSIPESIGNCTAFQVLDLSFNNFSGEIPFNIGFLQVATLSLQGNRFSGQIPSVIGLMQALAVLDLSCNMLVGTIPSILGNLTYTEKLYLQGNKLNGPIPAELGNMTKLHYLELNDNLLTGHIPPELGKLTDLFDLNVANNHLEGPIPDNLSSCTNLNSLNVHGNKLNGTIPPAFQRLESMTYLNLSSNNLKGPIPIELSRIGNLDTLDLSNNRISGYMPSSLGDLEHLLKLNLSNNDLSGLIPAKFGNLRSVMEIDLSNNHLSGPIPEELGQLQNVFLLKLENNNISGDVMSLSSCLSLTVLNVSYNNLAGYIPTGNNFSRFSPDSFLGNPGLCGYWLGSSCYAPRPAERVVISKAAILGIALGALAILLMILIAACRPHNPKPFIDGPLDKPGTTKKKKLDWETRLGIALGSAQGLAYLHHDCSPRIIHRDVKSSNILLDKDYEAHLTDFGIAKSLCPSKTHTSTYIMGTIGYIDPEYARTSRLTEKSDVYSYGIVLLELLTGRKAVDNESNLHHLILTKAASNAVMDTVDPEILETCKDLGEVKKVFQLALLCTKRQPLDRPTMHEVVRVLGTLVPPPEAKLSTPTISAQLQSARAQCYMDEYANLKTPHLVNCSSMSTSDAQLFLKFGEVISQNSV